MVDVEKGHHVSRDEGASPTHQPRSPRWWAIVVGTAVLVTLGLFVVTARATDASSFCKTCHEMNPYYTAWARGGHHSDAQCIDCHVNQGLVPRLAHKFVALGEVWSHFVGNRQFPLPTPATVPDSRCVRCHPAVRTANLPASFSHALHAKQGPCEMCHQKAGHDVTAGALRAAGIYSAENAAMRAEPTTAVATAGGGKADITGHVPVVCSRCHDMAATGCPACHKPPHEPRGNCVLCHAPGPKFTFAHPPTQMPNWQRIACKKCHPVSYTKVYCTCHKGKTPTGD